MNGRKLIMEECLESFRIYYEESIEQNCRSVEGKYNFNKINETLPKIKKLVEKILN